MLTNKVLMGKSDDFTIEFRPTEYSKKIKFENLAPTRTELDERFRCKINSEIAGDEKTAVNEELSFWGRAKQTIDLLRLESFYNEHKSEIMNILRIYYEYNQVARQLITQPLIRPVATAHTDLTSIRNLQYFAFLQPEEWGNSPLNKLKSDILDQLDEIENTRIDLQ